MNFVDFIQQYKLLEYIITGIFGIGLIIIVLFSSPIQKIKQRVQEYLEEKRKLKIALMQEANEDLKKQINEFSEQQQNFHAYVESNFNKIQDTLLHQDKVLKQLEESDQEQLRQLMDNIYFRYVNDKKIPQHQFDRYAGLYKNYKKEGGNGIYDERWAELQSWKKTA